MPTVRTLAIVLRGVEVMNTSKVLTLFTRELGKVSALGKGARRLKSPFQSSLDVLSVCDIVLIHKASDALDLLTEAVLEERHDALRHDLGVLGAAYYLAELLLELTDHHDPHPKLFDAARVTLRHLGEPELRPHRLIRFELACLRELGHAPSLWDCVHCGSAIDPQREGFVGADRSSGSRHNRDSSADEIRESLSTSSTSSSLRNCSPVMPGDVLQRRDDRIWFGLSLGGVLCPDCRDGQPHVATLPGRALESLRVLASPGDAWRRLDPATAGLGILRGTMTAVMSHLMGRRPRLAPYMGA